MNKIYCSHCGKEIKKDEEFIVANDNELIELEENLSEMKMTLRNMIP